MPAPEGNNYAEGNEGGRPSEYQPEYAKQVHKLCLLGATDAQIADFFGVTERTIHNWKKEHQEFFHSVSQGKIMADAEIAESLYKRARGYRYNEITREGELPQGDEAKDPDSDQVNELKVTKIVTKELPPDASAAMHWLKNRQPALWRDKQILGHEGEVTVTVIRTDPEPRDDS